MRRGIWSDLTRDLEHLSKSTRVILGGAALLILVAGARVHRAKTTVDARADRCKREYESLRTSNLRLRAECSQLGSRYAGAEALAVEMFPDLSGDAPLQTLAKTLARTMDANKPRKYALLKDSMRTRLAGEVGTILARSSELWPVVRFEVDGGSDTRKLALDLAAVFRSQGILSVLAKPPAAPAAGEEALPDPSREAAKKPLRLSYHPRSRAFGGLVRDALKTLLQVPHSETPDERLPVGEARVSLSGLPFFLPEEKVQLR